MKTTEKKTPTTFGARSKRAPLDIEFGAADRVYDCGEPRTEILLFAEIDGERRCVGTIDGEFADVSPRYYETQYRVAEYSVTFRGIPGVGNRTSDEFVIGDGEGEYANARSALAAAKKWARENAGIPETHDAERVDAKIVEAMRALASLSKKNGVFDDAGVAAFVSQAYGSLRTARSLAKGGA